MIEMMYIPQCIKVDPRRAMDDVSPSAVSGRRARDGRRVDRGCRDLDNKPRGVRVSARRMPLRPARHQEVGPKSPWTLTEYTRLSSRASFQKLSSSVFLDGA